jgi:hypothetical protein
MVIRKANPYLWLLGAMAAFGLSWAIADSTVVSHPGTIKGDVSFSAETLTKFIVKAYPSEGGASIDKTYSGQSLYTYDLTVEGGDPNDPNDGGRSYEPGIEAYFANGNLTTYCGIRRHAPILVDNNVNSPSAVVSAVDFLYPNTRRANFSIGVAGGTVSFFYVNASASGSPLITLYGQTSGSPSAANAATVASWIAMVPNGQVTLSGAVNVVAADGTSIGYNLNQQVVDLTQGPANVSWSIDLTSRGHIAGNVSLTNTPPISYSQVIYNGVYGTPSQGIGGQVQVSSTGAPAGSYTGTYSIGLPAGSYDVYLQAIFVNPDPNSLLPGQIASTRVSRINVSAGGTSAKDFSEVLGKGHVPLNVSGFYKSTDLSSTTMVLERRDPDPTQMNAALSYGAVNGKFDFALPSGTWTPAEVAYSVVNLTDPNIPVNNDIYTNHYSDAGHPAMAFAPGVDQSFAEEQITLVRSNIYFSATQPPGTPPGTPPPNVSSPYASVSAFVYNPDGTPKSYTRTTAHGSAASLPQSVLTMVAAPGTYQLEAYATVNGQVVNFGGRNITFGQPAPTPTGSGVNVNLTAGGANVDLNFSSVATSGVSTVVETPLGPAPPAGFQTICMGDFDCSPFFYDVQSTAAWQAPAICPTATVCVERHFFLPDGTDLPNGATDSSLRLWHYNHTAMCGHAVGWEPLDAPVPAYSCLDDDPGAPLCHCGSDCEGVFRVCGVTTSFSPFTVMQNPPAVTFTNQGYAGRTGPPLQQWTVPASGTYRIIVSGARGGHPAAPSTLLGGCGAMISGTFALQKDQVLQVLVGQQGSTSSPQSAGGGGGTFVVMAGTSPTPLIIAGGGGGVRSGSTVNGRNGSMTNAGVAGSTSASYATASIAGGTGGAGGAHTSSYGSGGGGWSGSGEADGTYGEGGFAFLGAGTNQGNGGTGKSCGGLADGGYGGGGAGNGCYGAGGGGGYSGGGGGRVAGGGGSYWSNSASGVQTDVQCTNDNGLVKIERVGL